MGSIVLPIPLVKQGSRQFCLYACTSMVLKYFGINKSMEDVASEVFFNFPGPEEESGIVELNKLWLQNAATIKAYLSDYGLKAKYYTDRNWDNIKKRIERGHALIAVVKADPSHWLNYHAWALRGYYIFPERDITKIVYNDPATRKELGDNDPVTFDPDNDSLPGESMSYDYFLEKHWEGPLPYKSRAFVAVSYKGQSFDTESLFDWRGAAARNAGDFAYHSNRMIKKSFNGEFVDAFFESLMVGVGFVGYVAGLVQNVGQLLEAHGKSLIERGQELQKKDGIGWKVLGSILIFSGGLTAGFVGYPSDFAGGVVGMIAGGIGGLIDSVGSFFGGAAGDSKSISLGSTHLDLGLVINCEPWRSRPGHNWEDVSGSWSVTVRDLSLVDELFIDWEVNIGGWGIDKWKLNRKVDQHSGSLVREAHFPTKKRKRFETKLTNSQGIRMSFWGRCRYGMDGGMYHVQLKVKAKAKLYGQSVTVGKSTNIYGLST